MKDSDHSQNSQSNMICPGEEHPEAPETSLIITDGIRSYSTLAKYPLRRSTYCFLPNAVAYQKQAIRSFKLYFWNQVRHDALARDECGIRKRVP